MIVLIVGSTGAGKTTYARKISKELPAVVYSIDNWMKDMYGADMPDDPTPDWFYENQKWYTDRIARCEALIKKICLERAKINQNSILDLGFSTKEHRLQFIKFFKDQGIPVQTHYLDVPADIRRQRVESRNQQKGETFVMNVDESLFNYMESIFEPPTINEGVEIFTVQNT